MNITTSGLAFIMAVVIPRLDDLSAEKKIKNIFTGHLGRLNCLNSDTYFSTYLKILL
jgi:hypothetical protein